MAAEAGILALVLFVAAIGAAFRNLRRASKSNLYRDDPEFRLFAQALRAALAAYLVGAFFASTQYNLYIYVVVAYTCVMARMAIQGQAGPAQRTGQEKVTKARYERIARPQPILGR
jgi:hypothetical protein